MNKYLIILHVLAATVWVGGHLVLAIGILPSVLKDKDVNLLLGFETKYERVGIPALVILVVTGIYMAISYLPIAQWFNFTNDLSRHISIKIILLGMTIAFAINARFRVIPNLTTKSLKLMAFHIISVTILAVLFLVTGLSFRLNIL
jgi:putative copper export protein